ncbi:ABC transporter permease [Streptomyces antnestii]|uniref:ABC transporter permease n=1 Tax=Streptomyces antnestii TaxID=2494256 RepID=A0A3S2WJ85_9ACTN|nr:ABC transporter permease [Streptomyces sp. San01]RVU23945.1 ABC transporter permease [Streptomyces sp. San01]
MTATTPQTSAAAPARPAATPRAARFADLLAAEWLKLWSLRSMRWTFGLTALGLVALNANAALADYQNWPHYDPRIKAVFVPEWSYNDTFTNNAGLVLMLIMGSVGAITVVGEYGTGLIRTTFAAVPARRSVMAAKAIVLTGVTLVYGAVASTASFAVSQAILSGRHLGLPFDYPGAWRGIVASALLAPVCALVGLGLGALIRHSATTMVASAVVLLLLPNMVSEDRRWSAAISHALPQRAWQRLSEVDAVPQHVPYPATVGGAWAVYVLWPLVAVAVALVVVDRRDV